MAWWNFFKFLIYSLFLGMSSSRDQSRENPGPRRRPHIIFILADDVGWNDVSYHGSDEIPTPNIDALAYHGVILDRHYVHPICTPSRTALMTGRYASRSGMQGVPMSAGELRGIPLNSTKLMPEHFKALGYKTRLLGKWHLGYYKEALTPSRRGFDSFYGYYNGLINYFDYMYSEPDLLAINVTRYDMHDDEAEGELRAAYPRGYFTDMITSRAEEVIKAHALEEPEDRPLFLEIAHLAGHASVKPDPLEVRDQAEVDASFGHIKNAERRKYAGMIKALDESVGRVVAALAQAKMLSNSIIVLASDNGAPTMGLWANHGSNHPFRGIKATLWEGGVRGLACVYSPLIERSSRVIGDGLVHEVDWLPTLYSAAGGRVEHLGVPLDGIDQWPMISRGGRSRRNRALLNIDEVVRTEAAIVGRHKLLKGARNDVTADFVGATGADPAYPAYRIDEVLDSMAGRAIRRLNDERGRPGPSKDKIARLRAKSGAKRCSGIAKKRLDCSGSCLFDLERDPCETRDISKQRPGIVRELEAYLEQHRKRLMPQTNTPTDPCSYDDAAAPGLNHTWQPWISAEVPMSDYRAGHCRYPAHLLSN